MLSRKPRKMYVCRRIIWTKFACFVTVMTVTLCGCSGTGPRPLSAPTSIYDSAGHSETEDMLSKVLSALDDGNAQSLKDLFSEYAIQNAPEMDQEIESLMAFYQGPSTSFQRSSIAREWHSSFGQESQGGQLGHGHEYYKAAYTINTESVDYKLRIVYYQYNEEDPSLNGLFLLEIAEMERYNASDFRFSDGKIPGVFCCK